jgi:Ca2+-binding RTX toxin-like protein
MANFYGDEVDNFLNVKANVNFYGGDGNDAFYLEGGAGRDGLWGANGPTVRSSRHRTGG